MAEALFPEKSKIPCLQFFNKKKMMRIIKWLFIKWHHEPILILHVIYSFVGQCIFLCKVKMLLYISLVPFVKRNVSYFHCSFIVSLYYTVAYYSEELVTDKDVAKPQMLREMRLKEVHSI